MPLIDPLDRLLRPLLDMGTDFTLPLGEPAMVPPDSVSWRVFRNPVTMFVGGIAAVLLELGEPRVRHGVWDHSSFKRDPAGRLRRTGMAAMVTVYGARSQFEALATRVNAMHAKIRGATPDGQAYAADDPELLLWVQATASWAFLEAWSRHVRLVPLADRDRYFVEVGASASLYGVSDPPASDAAMRGLFEQMAPRLEPSPILGELLDILAHRAILPLALRPLQRLGVRAAVDLIPGPLRRRIGLDRRAGLNPAERVLLRGLARAADRIELPSSAHAQARRRLGLSERAGLSYRGAAQPA